MNSIYSLILAAQPAANATGQKYIMPLIMVLFIVFFYFVVIRPQNKKKKEMDLMLKNLKKGDKVVSIGGIHGKVISVKDNEITVKVDANTDITFDKNAISKVADVANTKPAIKDTKEEK